MLTKISLSISLFAFLCISVFAQTHSSVSMGNQVYYILEQAELRGFCSPLSGVRPYTQSVVIGKINEILNSENAGKLNITERQILRQYIDQFAKPAPGLDWQRGAYYGEVAIGRNNTLLSANLGVAAEIESSLGAINPGNSYLGMELWLSAYMNGDLGKNISYDFTWGGGLVRAPRQFLGTYNTYYEGFDMGDDSEFVNQLIDVYSQPLTHFPYTYRKQWDGSVFFFSNLTGYDAWPDSIAGGYYLPAELTMSFFENKLIMRMGRITHDWSSTSFGSSLAFNKAARPLAGLQAEFFPIPWFGLASLTGILEYHNLAGIKESAMTSQNAFSITMLQFRYKDYLFFDIVDAVVYPKRFEIGYVAPIINSFFYQNNIGDFDNLALTFNVKAQYPGMGSMWVSLFVDEMNLTTNLSLDRQMVAYQAGVNLPLPILAFSSVKLSYTKINPYAYTHNRNFNPWHGDLPMETGYINNGISLGYYLPPNSDEILLRVKTMPLKNLITSLQYQMIRHGADFGSSAVDGSNLLSELDPIDRNNNPILKRYFLRDGAYQWMHILKISAEWNLPKLPAALFGEMGVNYSYFTNIAAEANVTGKAHPYSRINTSEYPESTNFIMRFGVKVFPR
ncbi:MAG: hypothetical protein FWG89_10475 [Treponema sp.]|nr:hypothetical protein [Treponema sp.]